MKRNLAAFIKEIESAGKRPIILRTADFSELMMIAEEMASYIADLTVEIDKANGHEANIREELRIICRYNAWVRRQGMAKKKGDRNRVIPWPKAKRA